jgi:hypothetical protein
MADDEQLRLLKRGPEAWNAWRERQAPDNARGPQQGQPYGHPHLAAPGPLPLTFLRGVGLPDALIEYLPSLLNQAIQHYSCFISYSSDDDEFALR